jgi:large subunit ribosomal protein L4
MELKITTLDGKEAGSVTLSDEIFGLEPRIDLIHRCIRWQLAKRRAGTHKVKNRAEINRTGKKLGRQKGSGGARHGSARVNLYRGGGRSFGPVVRSHEIGLPKKVRALALRHALSAKAKDGAIVIVDSASLDDPKTKALAAHFGQLGWSSALIIDGEAVNENFARAARNIPNIDVLPVQGINVYDLLRRSKLVLTRAAVDAIEARFNGADEPKRGRIAGAVAAAGAAVASAGAAVAGSVGSAVGSVVGKVTGSNSNQEA